MRYIFKCKEHGQFEVEQRIHEEHVAKCPECKVYAQRVYYPLPFKWWDGHEPESEKI